MRVAAIALSAAFLVVLSPFTAAQNSATAPTGDAEGLVRTKVRGLQSVYAVPDADLSRYRKVMLDPIEVSFSRNWDPQVNRRPMTAEEKQRIRTGLESVLRDEFARELGRAGRYPVVQQSGDDVLRIRAEIRDLVISAPDTARAETVRSYTLSAGEMTLVAELRDSASGALIARVADRYRDPESPLLELTTSLDNAAAARRAAARWSRILRERLDAAHAIGAGQGR